MAERVLSAEEVAQLGLDTPKRERALSADEVKALGLDQPAQAPTQKPRTGADVLRKGLAGMENEQAEMWGALAAGAHGAAMGLEGPINGVIEAMKHPELPPQSAERYRHERDRIEREQAANLERFPAAPVVGAVLAGGAGQAPTRLGRLGLGMAQGATYGAATSKGDLTKGEVAPVALDTVGGMALGGGGAVVGEGLNAGARGLSNKLGEVLQSNEANALKAAQKVFASKRGAYGGEVSSGQRILEMVERAAADPKADPALAQAAQQFLGSPEGTQLLNKVLRSNVGRSGDAVARIGNAQQAMGDAAIGMQQPAVDAAATARLNNPSALLRRLREILPKILLPAAGGALAGPEGAAAGALSAAVLGRSGTTVRNMMADPYVASRALGAGAAGLSGAGGAVSRGALPAAETANMSPANLLDKYLRLLNDPAQHDATHEEEEDQP